MKYKLNSTKLDRSFIKDPASRASKGSGVEIATAPPVVGLKSVV